MPPFLSEQVTEQVREFFKGLRQPVEVIFFGSQSTACEYCEQTLQLLGEVFALSDKLTCQERDLEQDEALAAQYGVDKVPAMVFTARDGDRLVDTRIRFYGIPLGSEFTTFINDLLLVSRRDSGLSAETRQFLKRLVKPVHLEVFVTPT
jgi:alkyl hydroperoxide reductase subunit AhpF